MRQNRNRDESIVDMENLPEYSRDPTVNVRHSVSEDERPPVLLSPSASNANKSSDPTISHKTDDRTIVLSPPPQQQHNQTQQRHNQTQQQHGNGKQILQMLQKRIAGSVVYLEDLISPKRVSASISSSAANSDDDEEEGDIPLYMKHFEESGFKELDQWKD